MTLVKRSRVRLLGAAAAMALGASITTTSALAADATNWPTQPVKLIVPFAPGGTSDVLAREIAARLQPSLGELVRQIGDRLGLAGGGGRAPLERVRA